QRAIACGAGVVAGRTQAGHHEQVSRIAQQRRDDRAAVQRAVGSHLCGSLVANTLAPISRCDSRTATGTALSKASAAEAATISAASSGRLARRTCTPAAVSTVGVAVPIGTCHGLNSPHSPR